MESQHETSNIQIFSVLKYCNYLLCNMLRMYERCFSKATKTSVALLHPRFPSWMAAILQVADGVTPPSFACGRAEPPVDYSPPTLPRQTDSVCACCHAMLHSSSSKKKTQLKRGYPYQNSSCLSDCVQLFPQADVWSGQDPPPPPR